MNYSLDTYNEEEMRAYRAARLYVQNAFLDAAKDDSDEVKKFVVKVLKVHGDISVEIH